MVDLRQKAGSELSFVTLTNGASSTDVLINTSDVSPGEYNLVIESFDSAFKPLALKTDTIKIIVVIMNSELLTLKGYSDTLAFFVTELKNIAIVSGKS